MLPQTRAPVCPPLDLLGRAVHLSAVPCVVLPASPLCVALQHDSSLCSPGLPLITFAAASSRCALAWQVAPTAGYTALSKRQSDVITAEACAALARYQAALQVRKPQSYS